VKARLLGDAGHYDELAAQADRAGAEAEKPTPSIGARHPWLNSETSTTATSTSALWSMNSTTQH
jgi:hypothetical protein